MMADGFSPGEGSIHAPPGSPSKMPRPVAAVGSGPRKVLMMAVVLCCATVPNLALSQTLEDGADVNGSGGPCQAAPQDRSDDDQDDAANNSSPDLERCNGLLTPPKTGDQEFEQQAPDTGTTPVIRPDALPKQTPE